MDGSTWATECDTGAVAIRTRRFGLQEFLALPEQKPALEYGPDGEITQKPMGTTDHSMVQANVIQILNTSGLGRAYPELRVVLGGLSRVPDVALYLRSRLPREQKPSTPPDVVVEVLSPDQAAGDLMAKCRWFVREGVQAAVLADPRARTLWAVTAAGERLVGGSHSLDLETPRLHLAPDDVFADILGE